MSPLRYSVRGIEYIIEIFLDPHPDFIYQGIIYSTLNGSEKTVRSFRYAGASNKEMVISPVLSCPERIAIMKAIEEFEQEETIWTNRDTVDRAAI